MCQVRLYVCVCARVCGISRKQNKRMKQKRSHNTKLFAYMFEGMVRYRQCARLLQIIVPVKLWHVLTRVRIWNGTERYITCYMYIINPAHMRAHTHTVGTRRRGRFIQTILSYIKTFPCHTIWIKICWDSANKAPTYHWNQFTKCCLLYLCIYIRVYALRLEIILSFSLSHSFPESIISLLSFM